MPCTLPAIGALIITYTILGVPYSGKWPLHCMPADDCRCRRKNTCCWVGVRYLPAVIQALGRWQGRSKSGFRRTVLVSLHSCHEARVEEAVPWRLLGHAGRRMWEFPKIGDPNFVP